MNIPKVIFEKLLKMLKIADFANFGPEYLVNVSRKKSPPPKSKTKIFPKLKGGGGETIHTRIFH